ncbi:MAG: zinc ribbon domain-containing protein [Acidimicrobiales bacterium]
MTIGLAKGHEAVVVEDLRVAAMIAWAKGSGHWRPKAGPNRAMLDVAPCELRRQLAYKTAWYGSVRLVIDRWYPSSKTYSRCKAVKAKLALSSAPTAANTAAWSSTGASTPRPTWSPWWSP